jgi:CDP-paratose 2-epimerase
MNYIITGGCGFLGSNIAAEILKRGEELAVFDNLSRFGAEQNLAWLRSQGEFLFQYGDIRDPFAVSRLVKEFRPDIIFHLAGQVAMTTSIANPRLDFEINALGTLNVLEAVREYCPECGVLYSSTNKVFGDLEYLEYEETATRYVVPSHPNGFD